MARHAVILGGTGQIGSAIAGRLLSDGWRITLASRGQRTASEHLLALGAQVIVVDRDQPGALRTALAGGADVVIDLIAYEPRHADQLLDFKSDVGAFVVISSCSVYTDKYGRTLDAAAERGFPEFDGPIPETTATVVPGPETYSSKKVAIEQRMLDHAIQPVAIVRPGAIHGPYTQHPREWWFVKRMLDGRAVIPLAYRGDSRLHSAAAANIAALIATAIDARTTYILNAADPEALTVAEIGAAIADHMGYRGTFLPLAIGDDKGHAPVGSTPWSLPEPFVLDMAAAAALGYAPAASYRELIGPYCDWLKQQDATNWQTAFPVLAGYPQPQFDYAAEDRYLRSLDAS